MSAFQSHRLFFVAILPPPDLQARITAIKQELADRYQARHALKSPSHITLFPPFRWPQAQVDQLNDFAEFAQQQPPVPVTLSGFGAFAPRVIYVHPQPSQPLLAVHQALQTFMHERLDLRDSALKKRGFTPHMTIANRDLKNFDAAWAEFESRSLEANFLATHLTLLHHTGHHWQIAQSWAFAA